MNNEAAITNALINETSPYLQQHAHNPVVWHAWNEETFQRAVAEDKPLLISIGYAACHWCHVMAHESFEDEETAEIMNANFICIKVDREERPDVDALYMRAVQTMTGSGGWPLHAFALPDGRPFFGGTYFPRSQWQQLCSTVANEYKHNLAKLTAFADKLSTGMEEPDRIISISEDDTYDKDTIDIRVRQLQPYFDPQNGGLRGSPKFPMPTLVNFLLKYSSLTQNEAILTHVKLTLEKMEMGGIYDHVGGGFARYSTDPYWKVPHFEKMLYDNAQLISLYSKGFRQFKEPVFKETVEGTAEFLLQELRTKEGLFASSLDADSEGVEGKYYVWDEEELRRSLGELFPTTQTVFNIHTEDAWENSAYVLHRTLSPESLASELDISKEELQNRIIQIRSVLFKTRKERVKPNLDHKALTSWNGLAIQGLAEAYNTFHTPEYLEAAKDAADFILTHVRMDDGGLFHSYTSGQARIAGFLEDYSSMIGGLISLYQSTFEKKWLYQARDLMEYSIGHFMDTRSGMFFFTSDLQTDLLQRDIELNDGVVPSSNSVIANDLFYLARYFEKSEWEDLSNNMVLKMKDSLLQDITSYSNWATLYLSHAYPFFDVAVCGPLVISLSMEMKIDPQANVLYAGSVGKSELPILRDRYKENKTLIYVCQDKVCAAPVETAAEALKLTS
ncbi:MAG: thioredoxin domain-containing protein [Pelolinea sp.]|nr:thioredoxin domain-containing protein [Pelolinea sp.]